MKKTWIAAGILLLYGLLTALLAFIAAHLYYELGETDTIFRDAEPWIKMFVSGFPMMQTFAVLTALAFFGIRGMLLSDRNAQRTKGGSV